MDIKTLLHNYDFKNLTIATLGSHSALDICSGAKKHGFGTLVIAEKGREKVYSEYYKSDGERGCVDEVIVLEKFKDILRPEIQAELRKKNAIFIPHRSFQVYLEFDYDAIENNFEVPIFGNRYLLKIEERGRHPNQPIRQSSGLILSRPMDQYDLLKEAGIRMPWIFEDPVDIDQPAIVKVLEKERGFERAFFIVSTPREYQEKSEELLRKGVISEEALQNATIEEFILGVQVNLNYFYSPTYQRLEFMGSDTRRQTNIEGFLRLPSSIQAEAEKYTQLRFEEAGHIAVTILESMLDDVFEIGERFVAAAQKAYPPGIIGPFALQAFIVPGPPKKGFVVFDVSPRMPGSPGIRFTPYTEYLCGRSVSVGERFAMEMRGALQTNTMYAVLT